MSVVSVTGPGADIDDVETLVDQVPDRGELGEDEGGGSTECGEAEGEEKETRWWREGR